MTNIPAGAVAHLTIDLKTVLVDTVGHMIKNTQDEADHHDILGMTSQSMIRRENKTKTILSKYAYIYTSVVLVQNVFNIGFLALFTSSHSNLFIFSYCVVLVSSAISVCYRNVSF